VIVSRRLLYGLSLLLLTLYLLQSLKLFDSLRDFLDDRYASFKSFLYYLSKAEEREPLEEGFLKSLFKRYGVKIKEISYEEGVYGIKADEVPATALAAILREVERRGRVEKLKAVDNTGRGVFSVELEVRPF